MGTVPSQKAVWEMAPITGYAPLWGAGGGLAAHLMRVVAGPGTEQTPALSSESGGVLTTGPLGTSRGHL